MVNPAILPVAQPPPPPAGRSPTPHDVQLAFAGVLRKAAQRAEAPVDTGAPETDDRPLAAAQAIQPPVEPTPLDEASAPDRSGEASLDAAVEAPETDDRSLAAAQAIQPPVEPTPLDEASAPDRSGEASLDAALPAMFVEPGVLPAAIVEAAVEAPAPSIRPDAPLPVASTDRRPDMPFAPDVSALAAAPDATSPTPASTAPAQAGGSRSVGSTQAPSVPTAAVRLPAGSDPGPSHLAASSEIPASSEPTPVIAPGTSPASGSLAYGSSSTPSTNPAGGKGFWQGRILPEAVPAATQATPPDPASAQTAVTQQSPSPVQAGRQADTAPGTAAAAASRAGPSPTQMAEPARLAEARPTNIVQQIRTAIEEASPAGNTILRLQLHPEALGRIQLQITRSADGLHIVLQPDGAVAARLLDQSLHDLRSALSEAGVQLGGLSIGHPHSQGGKSDAQPWATPGKGASPAPRSTAVPAGAAGTSGSLPPQVSDLDVRI